MEVGQSRGAAVVLFIAICLFAWSSWVDINGLWTEIPLLVNVLPEGWNLPSYIVIIIQVANVGPLGYVVVKKLKPDIVKEWIASCVIIIIGMISSFVLIFTWNVTSYVGGELHSTALFALSFFLALVDCTSSVVYLPYMARFKSLTFMTALYVGEGLSGLIPALIGLAQILGTESQQNGSGNGSGNGTSLDDTAFANSTTTSQVSPRFSISVFFVILTILLLISLVAFLFVNFHSYFDAFKNDGISSRTATDTSVDGNPEENATYSKIDGDGVITRITDEKAVSVRADFSSTSTIISSSEMANVPTDIQNEGLVRKNLKKLIIMYSIVLLINFLSNGILPSIQSYACMPYSYLTYDLAVKLSILANPLACFLTLALMCRYLSLISVIVAIGTFMAAYQIALAALSPNPILKGEEAGIVLAIISSVLISACFSYAKVCISTILSELGGERLLLYCGVFTQVGSLLGAIVAFLLVNVFKVFKSS